MVECLIVRNVTSILAVVTAKEETHYIPANKVIQWFLVNNRDEFKCEHTLVLNRYDI